MYTSLDKLDLVLDTPEGRLAVQTDHRSAEEIEASLDLSMVLGAIRAQNASLAPGIIGVRFVSPSPVPSAYAAFLQRFGAEVEARGGVRLPAEPDPEAARSELEAAWLRLGAALFDEHGLPRTLDALRQVEARMLAEATAHGDQDDDAWPRAVRLGGAAALVLSSSQGGKLDLDTALGAPINVGWWVGPTRLNVFDRAARFLQDEPGIPPSALVKMAGERDVGGEVMLSLRPADWPGASMALTIPVLPGATLVDPALPLLAIVLDRPASTQTLPKDTPEAELAGLRAEAVRNNRKRPVTTDRIDLEGLAVLVVSGHYFAAERLFDDDFMRGLHAELSATTLLAATPAKGLLLVAGADQDPRRASTGLAAIARGRYGRAAVSDRLSTQVLIVSDGAVVGLVRVEQGDPTSPPAKPAKKRGFWSRWFG